MFLLYLMFVIRYFVQSVNAYPKKADRFVPGGSTNIEQTQWVTIFGLSHIYKALFEIHMNDEVSECEAFSVWIANTNLKNQTRMSMLQIRSA